MQDVGDERQYVVKRLEVSGVTRHYMLDTARTMTSFKIRICVKLHDKCSLRGQR
jgi:hypothetical protein